MNTSFFDHDWIAKARHIKETRGELNRADLLKSIAEAYASERLKEDKDYRELRNYAKQLEAWKESAMIQLNKAEKLKDVLPSKYLGWDVYEASIDYIKSLKNNS